MRYRTGHTYFEQQRRAAWRATQGLLLAGLVACGSDSAGPPAAGSIHVQIATSGFLMPAGYDLQVAGVAHAVEASDEVTVDGLDPGEYSVALSNVPENCTADGVGAVTVTSSQTAEAALTIRCTFSEPATFTIQFSRQRPDLDTGAITVCAFGVCPNQEAWDMWIYNSTSTTPRSIVRQNQTSGVEIAHVEGVTLTGLNETHLTGAAFTTASIDVPFDAQRVILIRTDEGNVFALGDPTEDTIANTLTFSAALIAQP